MMKSKQNKDDLHNLGSEDLLSQMPDEILVSILSSFPLKEAAATSLLSRRWRYLWCQTYHLVFEDKKRWNTGPHVSFSNEESNKYMSWVNHIIHQHKSPTIDKFKICFDLDENAEGTITEWIKYAISKDVQTLGLNLTRNNTTCGNYSFSVSVMEIKFLKSLILKHVDVDDEGLKKILSNCPVLQHLSIHGSCKLVEAKIHGKGLALKNLEIIFCDELESIEICDSNIVSFSWQSWQNWHSSPIRLRLDNLRKLEKICISNWYSWKKINDIFCQISCCVPSLQVLDLDLYPLQGSSEVPPFCEVPQLKQLIIKAGEWNGDSLNVLISFVEACPNLERLKIQKIRLFIAGKTNRKLRQMAKEPYQLLEVVEIDGYEGGTSDFLLAVYFIQSCVALKKLVIKPFKKNGVECCARQKLEPRMPVGAELVIL